MANYQGLNCIMREITMMASNGKQMKSPENSMFSGLWPGTLIMIPGYVLKLSV